MLISTANVAGTPTFNLNVGGSATFDLFKIWTNETTVNGGEDTIPFNILVQFAFDPPASSGNVSGNTSGIRELFGVVQYGQVIWDGPAIVDFGNGGQYTLSLSNETFNYGLFGLNEGECWGANVEATLTYTAASVPEPMSMLLLGAGLAGLLGLRRRCLISALRRGLSYPNAESVPPFRSSLCAVFRRAQDTREQRETIANC